MHKVLGWRYPLMGAILTAAVFSACQCYPEPELVIQPPPPVPAVARKVSVVIVDSATNALVTKPLTVTLRNRSGALAASTRDNTGKAANTFNVSNGLLTFQVAETAQLPYKFTAVVRGTGYNTGSGDLEITKDGAYDLQVRMVSISNPPEGVTAVQQSAGSTTSSGQLQAAQTIETPAEANTGGTTQVTLPANTVITTANGTPLTGALTATVSYYNNEDGESLSAFPGGLEVEIPSVGARTFVSGGFTAIEVTDSAGNLASNFSLPITVKVAVPTSTINPKTNAPVQVGQTIPFWSYNELTGQWAAEGNVTLQASTTPGVLDGVGTTTHLSYYNLDWEFEGCTSRTIRINGNPNKLNLVGELKATGGGFFKTTYLSGDNTQSVNFEYAAPNVPVNFSLWFNGSKVGETNIDDLCASGDVSVNVTLPTPSPATVLARVRQACSNDPTVVTPVPSSTIVVIPAQQAPLPTQVTDANGEARFTGLTAGANLTINAQNSAGTFYPAVTRTLTAGENVVDFQTTVECAVTSGAQGGNR